MEIVDAGKHCNRRDPHTLLIGMQIKTAWWLLKISKEPYDHLIPLQGIYSQSKQYIRDTNCDTFLFSAPLTIQSKSPSTAEQMKVMCTTCNLEL